MSKIILFDEVCNTCYRYVQFVIKRDKKKNYLFASLQSEIGNEIIKKVNHQNEGLKSIVLIHNNNLFTNSTARLKIASNFNGFYKVARILLFVPRPVRDFIFMLIFKKTHIAFKDSNKCRFPKEVLRERFIVSDIVHKAEPSIYKT